MTERPGTIRERGRAKAYRPLPAAARREALGRALDAWDRGDFFIAHELLEPAWMGARDPAERALHSGLIKLAAAFVHDVRGNPAGVAKNLAGARERLLAGVPAATALGLDVPSILEQLDACVAMAHESGGTLPIMIRRQGVSVP